MHRLAIGFMAAAGFFAHAAQAATHSISNTTPVFINGSYNGSFDVRPLLGASGKVTQASILLRFIDDIEIAATVPWSSTSYNRTGVEYDQLTQYGNTSYLTHYVEMLQTKGRSVTDLSAETATAHITGETAIAGTAAQAGNQKIYSQTTRQQDKTNCLQPVFDWSGNSYCALAEAYFTQDTTDYYGKLGEFVINFNPIGAQALADLNTDGLLDFNISFANGQDATLLESRIDFDVQVPAAAGVPEPSLLALLGVGMLAMLQRRRQVR
ncbi:MAG: PEP-CTERM sorting domain-containing protein [Chitinivorax sp.]